MRRGARDDEDRKIRALRADSTNEVDSRAIRQLEVRDEAANPCVEEPEGLGGARGPDDFVAGRQQYVHHQLPVDFALVDDEDLRCSRQAFLPSRFFGAGRLHNVFWRHVDVTYSGLVSQMHLQGRVPIGLTAR